MTRIGRKYANSSPLRFPPRRLLRLLSLTGACEEVLDHLSPAETKNRAQGLSDSDKLRCNMNLVQLGVNSHPPSLTCGNQILMF